MNDIVVDFETYYSKKDGVSAATQGLKNYVDTSYAYVLALKSASMEWVGTPEEAREKFPAAFWSDPNNRFWAANSNFDEAWVRKEFDAGDMKPWNCVLDRGAWSQLPRHVAGLTRVVLGVQIDKKVRDFMDGKHSDDLTGEERAMVWEYCMNDAREEYETLQRLPQPTAVEERIATHTRMINRRGVAVNAELVEADRQACEQWRHDCLKAIPWGLETGKPLSMAHLGKWAAGLGIEMPATLDKRDDEAAEVICKDPRLAEVVGLMRGYRKANTVLKKIASIQNRLDADNIMPLDMIYCGARHTRRWSSQGVNVQNLESEPFKLPDGREVAPRHWIVPRPGKKFLILDYAQIEPRCLHWLTFNEAMLDMIRKGFGVYEAAARAGGLWSGEEPLKAGDPKLYKLVKAQELGLGYGMGVGKFSDTFRPLLGVEMDGDAVKDAVQKWRMRNHRIVGFWGRMDKLIAQTILNSGDRELAIEMPTGDHLRHFSVISRRGLGGRMTQQSLTIKGDTSPGSRQMNLWGGVLVENVTQRMARDVLAEAVLRLEDAGFPVIFHAHDEVVLEVDENAGGETVREASEIMKQAPGWAPDLPLDVEGGFHSHYTK